ncbi:MAG: hypothetical protein H7A47_12380 [Verrucomicrobiales bacterium]|nr:hypothetical protein [Verrucomicrobiales bacterium]
MTPSRTLRRVVLAVLALLLLAVAAGWAGLRWQQHREGIADDRLYALAGGELTAGRPAAALALIDRRVPLRREAPWRTRRWLDVEIGAATLAGAVARLDVLQQRAPKVFLAHEEACLLLARAGLHAGQDRRLESLAAEWSNRTTNAHRWFALQVDRLLLEGRRDEAFAALTATNFAGPTDAVRLTRLALVTASTNLLASWDLLDQARRLAPRSPDVRLFRAQILEENNQPRRARLEYVAAWLADPANPWLADQLAEFYRRRGNHAAAVEVWGSSLTNNPVDFVALKWAFWHRVTAGDTTVPDLAGLAGPLGTLARRIVALPPGRFWDEDIARAPGITDRLLRSRPEVFWLRLLEALRQEDHPAALDQLRAEVFDRTAWFPELRQALVRLLSRRQLGTLNPIGLAPLPDRPSRTNQHAFFVRLESAAASQPARTDEAPAEPDFWARQESLAVAFLAAGWLRAGLSLVPDPVHPGALDPDDAYTWAQALRYGREAAAALEFLQSRAAAVAPEPELRLIEGELLLADGRVAEAEAALKPLAARNAPAATHAAWLLATLAVEQARPAEAAAILEANPDFAGSVAGRELAARVALLRQDTNAARALYTDLGPDSIEGRVFFAREAFAARDWPTARRLTEGLLVDVPDSMPLRANLETIRRAETGSPP